MDYALMDHLKLSNAHLERILIYPTNTSCHLVLFVLLVNTAQQAQFYQCRAQVELCNLKQEKNTGMNAAPVHKGTFVRRVHRWLKHALLGFI